MSATTMHALIALALLLAAAPQADASSLLRRLLEKDDKWRDTVKRETQGAAWTSSKGQYAGAVDAFTKFSAEATSTSSYNGIYFNSDIVTVEAGDRSKGSWVGALISNNPGEPEVTSAVSTDFENESSTNKGVTAISGTSEHARATAGSGGMFNAAHGAVVAANILTYAPWSGDRVTTGMSDPAPDVYRARSVAFTNVEPNSAAQIGIGDGPEAYAAGFEVAASARSGRDHPKMRNPVVTIGHREKGEQGTRRMLLRGARKLAAAVLPHGSSGSSRKLMRLH